MRCAQAQAQRRLLGHVRDRAREQGRYARAVRARAEWQTDEAVNRWPVTHGLRAGREERSEEDALALVLTTARALFGGCDLASLTTVGQFDDRHPYRTATSTGIADVVDAAQFRLREGPGIDAVELDMVVVLRVDDFAGLDDVRRWPRFSPVAKGLGVRSCLIIGVPWTASRVGLHPRLNALGTINFYERAPHAFHQTEHHGMMLGCWAASFLSGREPAEIHRASF